MELKEVFEPIINFMKNFQKKDKDISKQAAKDRLKLVLMQDRASVSPDFFEMMKKEIIDVIKKYIEIDEESLEVQLTRGYEAGLEGPALYANIPIKNIKPVAPDGEDVEKITDAIADEILDEASQKVEEMKSSINVDEEEKSDKVTDDEPKSVDSIAENVAKEMKKSAKTVSRSKASTAKKSIARKTTKKSNIAE